jgi:hypothetical protein
LIAPGATVTDALVRRNDLTSLTESFCSGNVAQAATSKPAQLRTAQTNLDMLLPKQQHLHAGSRNSGEILSGFPHARRISLQYEMQSTKKYCTHPSNDSGSEQKSECNFK